VVTSLLSSRLLTGNVKVKVYKTIILPVVFIGMKHSLSHYGKRVRVFENRVLR
jgi:hypothetical protein